MPPSMRSASAPSISRSTVHHQSPNGVRCVREAMSSPNQDCPVLVWPGYGFHLVKKLGAGTLFTAPGNGGQAPSLKVWRIGTHPPI